MCNHNVSYSMIENFGSWFFTLLPGQRCGLCPLGDRTVSPHSLPPMPPERFDIISV